MDCVSSSRSSLTTGLVYRGRRGFVSTDLDEGRTHRFLVRPRVFETNDRTEGLALTKCILDSDSLVDGEDR